MISDTSSSRILITGATGWIGRRLSQRLRDQGARVVGLSRNAARARQSGTALHEAHDWRGARDVPPAEAFSGCHAVVHLAGEPVAGRWTAHKRTRIEESRVLGTARIVDAIERCDPRPSVLVSASGIGFYGDRGDEELTEEATSGDGFLAGVCVGWEREARRAETLGVRVVQLRLGLVLGRDGGALRAMRPVFQAGLGGRIGDGRQWWSWIHLEDAVSLFCFALESEALRGPVNAVSPTPVRQVDFAQTLAHALSRPAIVPAPAFAVRAALGGVADELLSSRRALPTQARAAGFTYAYPELAGAFAAE